MRAALWLLALFGIAVAIALFAGNNQGTITVFWPPYRVDLSLNLVLLLLVAAFVFVHLALRALAALFSLPRQARRWRTQQKERAMHTALFDALAHLLAGRFVRASRSAEAALHQEASLQAAKEAPPHAGQVRTLAHLLLAESAQSLQDKGTRDTHLAHALEQHPRIREPQQMVREGVQLRAARWALDDRDASAALRWLDDLPQGAQRRTLALRLRLKAARQARQTLQALETARLLAKHRAFSAGAAQSIVRGLALELLNAAHDPAQLQRAWSQLEAVEHQMPEVAIQAAQRLQTLHGDVDLARQWLLPVWEQMVEQGSNWPDSQRVRLIRALEAGFEGQSSTDTQWLTRIESALARYPRDAKLQYLAGMVCLQHQLWGKAQQLLQQAAPRLQDAGLHRSAWRALALLAEQREDTQAAAQAWKQAAEV